MQRPTLASIGRVGRATVSLALVALSLCATAAQGEEGWISLFDGKSLDGWRASENADSFSVVDGAIRAMGPRSHLFYVGGEGQTADFKNFEFSAECMARAGANSGLYFHTAFQEDGWPGQGFEVQINNTQEQHGDYLELKKTGSLYGVRNLYRAMAGDDEWFTMAISVRGRQVQVRLNDQLLVDYIQPTSAEGEAPVKALSRGTFALQGHDPDSVVFFRNLKVKPLADALEDPSPEVVFDAVDREIIRLGRANYPLVDLHVHIKGDLTLEKALAHGRRTGIQHGIAVNGGVGFPITTDEGIEEFRLSMQGVPCFIGLQAEGREWPTLFSREAIAKFDYVFTDAMTIVDHRGQRARLWMPDEVDIPDTQAFMDHLVQTIEGILDNEPVDFYANATFLPAVIADQYEALWTPERMDRVVAALARNSVAMEINSRYRIPSAAFIRKAKEAGVKFTLGTNNVDVHDLGRNEYGLEMIRECGLQWQDFWMPAAANRPPR